MESVTLQQIETFGAGIIALGFVFGIVFLLFKDVVPALRKIGDTLSAAIATLDISINLLDKTMRNMQEASSASLAALDKRVMSMETKLDYHVSSTARMETKVDQAIINVNEVKERTRNCTGMREPSMRSRKEDKI